MLDRRIAFVFPGQGSQQVGMLDSFKGIPVVQETIEEANEALGFDLGELIEKDPNKELDLTVNTQPALLAVSVAIYRYYMSLGGRKPEMMAGHSLGEYSALVAAGAIKFKDAIRLARFRAKKMQEAVPVGEGSMVAVLGLSDEKVKEVCTNASDVGVVEPVNFNTPGQVVIAGQIEALKKAQELCKDAGAKRTLPLKVSGPFHCSLMQPASQALRERLEEVDIKVPEIKVLHNVDTQSRSSATEIKEALANQVASAVLWADTIRVMERDGITNVFECGPGAALNGMLKRIAPALKGMPLSTKEAVEQAANLSNTPIESS
ncbi:MAG: ACP S-malonyltransferase [Burkholderiales bacterium]|nr:ACP S-malonyltransferase [Burkholderiales bacterium]